MCCLLCGSGNQAELTAEMVIQFSGLKNLDKPEVFVFSRLLVCLECGGSQFKIPEKELAAVAENTRENASSAQNGAVVALSRGAMSQLRS